MRNHELDRRITRYDKWIAQGRIPASSSVIPVAASLPTKQWVLPSQQIMEFVAGARLVALAHCDCRGKHKNCDNPTEVCLLLNQAAEAWIAQGKARRIGEEQARAALELADRHGLVHLAIHNPEQHPFAVCSCCSCCCHDMQFLKSYNRGDLIAHSDFLAVWDQDSCTNCGLCVERCHFEARVWQGDELIFHPDRCYGCGVCVAACPSGALSMAPRD